MRVFTHCLSCRTPFPRPDEPGLAVPGDHLAYDPERGRLWSICAVCRSWTLAPIEERWETLERLERLTSARRVPRSRRALLLSRTENVALYRAGPLRLVRIGATGRLEEAWWRYGRAALERLGRARRMTAGRAATLGAAVIGGVLATSLPGRFAFRSPGEVRRWLRFGTVAWAGSERCASCGHGFASLTYFDRRILVLQAPSSDEAGPRVTRRCPSCGDAHGGGLRLSGMSAEQTLRRVLDYELFAGVSDADLRAAVALVEREGARELVGILLRHPQTFGDLPLVARIALDAATDEVRERRLADMEARALETWWREAEALAAIVDGELTDVPTVERLRRSAVRGP